VTFRKGVSVGLRLAGGNATGIFVSAVLSGSDAAAAGLTVGDKVLAIDGADAAAMTREEAVTRLLAAEDYVSMRVQRAHDEFEQVASKKTWDSFYVR